MRRRLVPSLLAGLLLAGCAGSRAAGPPAGSSATAAEPVAPPAVPAREVSPAAASAPTRADARSPATGARAPATGAAPSTAVAPGAPVEQSAAADGTRAPPEDGESSEARAARDEELGPGIEAFRAGRWEQAAEAFRAALRRHPEDVDAQFNLALSEERLGAADRARAAYEAALRLAPEHLPSLVNLARLDRQTGRAEHAAQVLEAASRRPALASRPALWVQLSLTERVAGNLDAAEQAARRALSLRRDPGAYEALALVASARGQDREAELLANSALRLDEARASTHVTLGVVAYRLGEVGRARAEFDRAAALDPSSADAWANLGGLALGWRDYAGAERAYRHATELEPWSIDSRLHLGEALAAEASEDPAKVAAAGRTYREVLARAPDRPEAICGAGWALGLDRAAVADAGRLLRRCRDLPGTAAAERRRIDGRLAALESLARAPASPAAGPEAASSRSGGGGVREQASGTGGGR
jgi:Tfp pilus assembly protein PilF